MTNMVLMAKCDDRFSVRIGDDDWRHGYVPEGIGIGGGDYLRLTINMETGQIVHWTPITKADLDRAWEE